MFFTHLQEQSAMHKSQEGCAEFCTISSRLPVISKRYKACVGNVL